VEIMVLLFCGVGCYVVCGNSARLGCDLVTYGVI